MWLPSRASRMLLVALIAVVLLANVQTPVLADVQGGTRELAVVASPSPDVADSDGDGVFDRPDATSARDIAQELGERVEDLSQRTSTTQVFANADGTWTTEQSAGPVRVQDPGTGEWGSIDTTLVESSDGWRPKAVAGAIAFSDGGEGPLVAMDDVDGRRLTWSWPTELPTPTVAGSVLTYHDVVPNGDLVVDALATGFSHSVVLREAPSEPLSLPMVLDTDGAQLAVEQDGSISISEGGLGGDGLVSAPSPTMWDSPGSALEGAGSEVPVEVTLAGRDRVVLRPDQEYLTDPDTAYPVTIDPTYSNLVSDSVSIFSGDSPDSSSPYLMIGNWAIGIGPVIGRSLLAISGLPTLDTVTSASLSMYSEVADSCDPVSVKVQRVMSGWVADSSLDWDSQPAVTSSGESSEYLDAHGGPHRGCNHPGWDTWDITSIAEAWASGAPNYGLRLSLADEGEAAARYYYSSLENGEFSPQLTITGTEPPDIDEAPNEPTGLSATPCDTQCADPMVVTSTSPTLAAVISDPDTPMGSMHGDFEVRSAGSGTAVASGAGTVDGTGAAEFHVPAGILSDGESYEFRVGARDAHTVTWSDWVGFAVEVRVVGLSMSPCVGSCLNWVTDSATPQFEAITSVSSRVNYHFEITTPAGSAVTSFTAEDVAAGDPGAAIVPPGALSSGQYRIRFGIEDGDRQNRHTITWTPGWQSFVVQAPAAHPTTPSCSTQITGTVTWSQDHSPYVLNCSLTVATGGTLRLEPGTVVKIAAGSLNVNGGRLQAQGTGTSPIIITAYRDDSIMGDTNGDGPSMPTNDGTGYWGQRLTFDSPAPSGGQNYPTSTLDNVAVLYGGKYSGGYAGGCRGSDGALAFRSNARVQIDHSLFDHYDCNAISGSSTGPGYSVTVANTVFTGVTPRGGAALDMVYGGTFTGNVFYGGTNYTIMSTSGALDLNFTNNIFGGYLRFQLDHAPPSGQPMFSGNSFAWSNEPDFLITSGENSFDLTNNWWQRDINLEPVPTCYVENAFPEYRRATDWGNSWHCYRFRIVNKSVNRGYLNTVIPALSEAPTIPGAGLEANPVTGEELAHLWDLSLGSASNGEFAFRPTGEQSDPVNSAIGSYTEEVTDAALSNLGYPLVFGRTYNSADDQAGIMGPGWSTSLENSLTFPETDRALFHASDGQRITFTREDGTWSGGRGVTAKLSDASGGGYVLMTRAQVRYRFNSQGRIQSILDRNGQGVQFTWDNGKIVTAASSGRSLTFSYGDGRLSEVTQSDGREATFTYTNDGLLHTATSRGGVTTTYAYDGADRLTSESQTTSSGSAPRTITLMELDYDATTGRVESQTDALGHATTFAWDPIEEVSTVTAPDGGTWIDDYTNGVLFARVDPLGRTTFYDFDRNLRLTYARDPRGIVTRLVYDHHDDLVKAHTRSGTTATDYNNRHDPVKTVDPRGVTSTYEYDTSGNLTETTLKNIDGQTVTSSVDPDPVTGLPLTSTDETGKVTHYTYQATSGDLTDMITPTGRRTHYGYDTAGRLISSVDPRGYDPGHTLAAYTSTYSYNDDDQPETQSDPLGNLTSLSYDDLGRLEATEDAKQAVTTYSYDDAGNLTSVVQPGPQQPTTEYGYDANGNLATLTDPDGRTVTYTYDRANQLTSQTGPVGTTDYSYDADGLPTSKTRPDGSLTRYSYSNRGYLVGIDYPNSPDVTFTNDAQGNRTSMTDVQGQTTFGYDGFGRPKAASRTYSNGAATASYTYSYLDNGLLQATTGPGGSRTFTYDNDGLLKTVKGSAGTLVTYDYDSAGNPVHAVNGDTSTWTRGYDRAGRMVSLTDIAANGTPLLEDTIAYDAVGNPTQVTHANGSAPDTHDTYTYDSLTRLTGVCYETTTCTGATDYVQWTYDPVGNRTSEIRPTGTATYSYDPTTGSLATIHDGSSTTTFEYDDLGRLTGDGTTTYGYNDADNLTTETTASAATAHGYDGDGNRLRTTVGSAGTPDTITNEYRDPLSGTLTAETNGAGALQRAYIDGLTHVGFTTNTSAGPSNGHWFHTDIQGTVRAVTDNAGDVSSTATYEPYGVLRSSNTLDPSDPANPIGWAGEYTDTGGQSHLGARQYDPEIGAFVIPDPAETTFPSATYSYAGSNPMTRSDPTGLCSVCDVAHEIFVAPITDAVGAIDDAVQICSGNQKGSCGLAILKATALTLNAVMTYTAIGGAAALAGRVLIRGAGMRMATRAAANAGDNVASGLARTCLRSFTGDTLVLMADGTKKPIKDIEVGDKIIATDPETGQRVARKVTWVWVHDDQVIDLLIDGKTITTTEDHPFWSATDHTFEDAYQLASGELVLGDRGRLLTVSGLRYGTERTAQVYNLSIAGIHTYHVGDDAVLVHNTCKWVPKKPGYTENKVVLPSADAAEEAAMDAASVGGRCRFRPLCGSGTHYHVDYFNNNGLIFHTTLFTFPVR
jgi:RHS repeat-associated protein